MRGATVWAQVSRITIMRNREIVRRRAQVGVDMRTCTYHQGRDRLGSLYKIAVTQFILPQKKLSSALI